MMLGTYIMKEFGFCTAFICEYHFAFFFWSGVFFIFVAFCFLIMVKIFYRYLNQQHIKKQKLSEADIIFGSMTQDSQEQMEIGELGTVFI